MDKAEKEHIEKVNADALDVIQKGLITDPDAISQIHRMIGYNEERIKKEYKESL